MLIKPFLKWAGGKARSAEHIIGELPTSIRTYWEPFLGGGAVFFTLAREEPRRFASAVLSDSNRDLIDTYIAVRDFVDDVIAELGKFRHSEKAFYAVRRSRPRTPAKRAARIIYLNRTAFNGLYRVDSHGQFNVPFGAYDHPRILNEEVLRGASSALQWAEIYCSDFSIARGARPGDAVYFDPPYLATSKTAQFTTYDSRPFRCPEHSRLAYLFEVLGRDGVACVGSNSDCRESLALYSGHRIQRLSVPRAINSAGGKRGPVGELLITAVQMVDQQSKESA